MKNCIGFSDISVHLQNVLRTESGYNVNFWLLGIELVTAWNFRLGSQGLFSSQEPYLLGW